MEESQKLYETLEYYLKKLTEKPKYVHSSVPKKFETDFEYLLGMPNHYEKKTDAENLFINIQEIENRINENRNDSMKKQPSILIQAMSLPLTENSSGDKARDAIVELMIKKCPYLILQSRTDSGYEGQTALHLAILQDKKMTNFKESITYKMLKAIENEKHLKNDECEKLFFHGKVATGKKFKRTRMSAGTILGVAAMSGNKETFNYLSSMKELRITDTNENKDNIIHSLINHSSRNDDKLLMIKHVLKKKDSDAEELLLQKNNDSLTPLQLASQKGAFEIFAYLLDHWVYRRINTNDGLKDLSEYDITEIETFPTSVKEDIDPKIVVDKVEENKPSEEDCHKSVLGFIGILKSPSLACKFISLSPVRNVIKHKWHKYCCKILGWAIFHIISMIFIMIGGNFRQIAGENSTDFSQNSLFSHGLIGSCAIIQLLNGSLYTFLGVYMLVIDICKMCKLMKSNASRQSSIYQRLSHAYSNSMFLLLFPIFGLCLLLDFVLQMTEVTNYDSILLPFAIIFGCYLILFFMQVIPFFSYFTVLIQKVVPDLLRFLFVMAIILVGFSMAMFIVMKGADTTDDSFEHYGKSLMTMFQVMLGIGDIGLIFSARKPFAAIIIFVVFVIFTTILLLNALIAIMSNTCSTVTSFKDEFEFSAHCFLQKLSVILLIEYYLCDCLKVKIGEKRGSRRYLQLEMDNDEDDDTIVAIKNSRKLRKNKQPKISPINKPANDCKIKVSKTYEEVTKRPDLESMEIYTIEKK